MASAVSPGQFSVYFADTAEQNPTLAYSEHTNIISGGAKAAPTGATYDALPKAFAGQIKLAKCAGRVLIYFTPDAAVVIESEESQMELPCVLYDSAGNIIGRKTLTFNNTTGYTAAGTVDITIGAGVPGRICYYDVPRGVLLGIDANGKPRAYMGDNA